MRRICVLAFSGICMLLLTASDTQACCFLGWFGCCRPQQCCFPPPCPQPCCPTPCCGPSTGGFAPSSCPSGTCGSGFSSYGNSLTAPATVYQPRPIAPLFAAPFYGYPRTAAVPQVETRPVAPMVQQTPAARMTTVTPIETRRPVITSGQWEPIGEVR